MTKKSVSKSSSSPTIKEHRNEHKPKKNYTCTIQGHKARGTNDMIKTHAICSKDYITHNGREKTLENYSFEHLKCGFECKD